MSNPRPVYMLPAVVNDVLVTTAKAFRAAKRDDKANPAAATSSALETRIPAAYEKFNAILDEMECEFLMAKAVLERDLKQLRAKRQPAPEPKPVAPPAPMAIDVEPPAATAKEPLNGAPGPSLPGSQASKPVAPFPNMGFDNTSPKVAPSPNLKTAPNPKETKNHARSAMALAAAGRPTSAPPKKDVKAPPTQVQRPSSVAATPQPPLNHQGPGKPPSVPPASRQTPTPTPAVAAAAVTGATSAPAANENLFTDMTFSLAPPPGEADMGQPQISTSQQSLPAAPMSTTANQGAANVSGPKTDQKPPAGPADVANMDVSAEPEKGAEDRNMTDVDDKIDSLFGFSAGDMDNMDLGYDLGNADNSNFNDMYFPSGDNSGGAGEFDDAFLNLNG